MQSIQSSLHWDQRNKNSIRCCIFFYTCLCNFASVKTQKSRIYHSYVVAGLCSVPDAITSQQNKAPTPEVQESTIYLLQWPTVRVCSLLPLRAEVHRRGWRGAQTPKQPAAFLTGGHFSRSPQTAPLSQSHALGKKRTHTDTHTYKEHYISGGVVFISRLFSCLSHCPTLVLAALTDSLGSWSRRRQHTEFYGQYYQYDRSNRREKKAHLNTPTYRHTLTRTPD